MECAEGIAALYHQRETMTYAEFVYSVGLIFSGESTNDRKGVAKGDTHVGPDKIDAATGYGVRVIKSAAAEVKRRGLVTVARKATAAGGGGAETDSFEEAT